MSDSLGSDMVPEGRYANLFQVGFNGYEFILDFGQQYPPEHERIHTRIVTSPSLARDLFELLHNSLQEYERTYHLPKGGQ